MNDDESLRARIINARLRHGLSTAKFLEQQQRLADGLSVETIYGEKCQTTQVFEPVTFTRAYRDDDTPNIVIGSNSRIDSDVKIEGGLGVRIGDHVHIASKTHLNVGGGTLIIRDGAAVASSCIIITGGNAPDAESCSAVAPIEQQVLHRRTVILERNACIYARVMVMPGVVIGEGARVMPGSIVTHNVPAFEIWRGTPARFLRNRSDVQNGSKAWEGIHHCEDCGGHSRVLPCPFCLVAAEKAAGR